ncbi:hypothetical protein C1645_818131 [Glomus cerebriforme]|uniref:Uncharacterized protein n=1 Tax=Glomus cerebriforme TaxID=658196 RepID=A0A397TCZ4_9GLOM|nr:hypothetical protein C1645_818131 [Glomus cerebriforme]
MQNFRIDILISIQSNNQKLINYLKLIKSQPITDSLAAYDGFKSEELLHFRKIFCNKLDDTITGSELFSDECNTYDNFKFRSFRKLILMQTLILILIPDPNPDPNPNSDPNLDPNPDPNPNPNPNPNSDPNSNPNSNSNLMLTPKYLQ